MNCHRAFPSSAPSRIPLLWFSFVGRQVLFPPADWMNSEQSSDSDALLCPPASRMPQRLSSTCILEVKCDATCIAMRNESEFKVVVEFASPWQSGQKQFAQQVCGSITY